MGRTFSAIVLFLCALQLQAQSLTILKSEPAVIPAFDAVRGLGNAISQQDYDKIVTHIRAQVELHRTLYQANGVELSAYVARAKDRRRTLPVIVLNRGGYVEKQPLPFLLPAIDRYTSAGFLVIAPMLRGSDGEPGRDEMGGAEFSDLAAVVKDVRAFGDADPDNIFMAGESRGGVMTLLSIRAGLLIRAAAVWGAISDMAAYLGERDPEGKLAHAVWPDFDEHREQILRDRSALSFAADLKVPLLIMHGASDRDVPPQQSLALASELQKLSREYQLHIFAGDNHVLKAHQEERDHEVIEWFRSHAGPASN